MSCRRLAVVVLEVIISLSVHAAKPTDREITVLPEETAAIDVYARAKGNHWALVWDFLNDSSYVVADIVRLTPGLENGDYDYESAVTVSVVRNGQTRRICEDRVRHRGLWAALRLVKDADNFVMLTGGDGMRVGADADIPCLTPPGSRILLRCFGEMSDPVTDIRLQKRIPLRMARFAGVSDVLGYLAQSSDSTEGAWEYMDREMLDDGVVLGGYYRLATVRNEEGGYDIILLDRVSKYPSLWHPLAIRGSLCPTIFPNNFDLKWTDGRRLEVFSDETWAAIELGGTVLKLNFPLLKSTLRFRRVPIR